ncbi:uncharacterized protein, partial [Melanerpes formicivorus]|uniref:uncharacterized protein n=1 Tax=Melanerpes formicivorus TaxID=211600 RepID=UPI00358EAD54
VAKRLPLFPLWKAFVCPPAPGAVFLSGRLRRRLPSAAGVPQAEWRSCVPGSSLSAWIRTKGDVKLSDFGLSTAVQKSQRPELYRNLEPKQPVPSKCLLSRPLPGSRSFVSPCLRCPDKDLCRHILGKLKPPKGLMGLRQNSPNSFCGGVRERVGRGSRRTACSKAQDLFPRLFLLRVSSSAACLVCWDWQDLPELSTYSFCRHSSARTSGLLTEGVGFVGPGSETFPKRSSSGQLQGDRTTSLIKRDSLSSAGTLNPSSQCLLSKHSREMV